jgi:predicted DsbA family dithiol-disulfide isomerase
MHVWIFTNQRQIFSMSRPKSREELMAGLQQVREKLVNGAKELGLDHERMRAALEDNRHQAEIMKRVMSAQSLGINGTPAVYVNDMYVGSNLDMVKALDKEYLKKDKEKE